MDHDNQTLLQQLLEACKNNDIVSAKLLVAKGANVNAKDKESRTPIFLWVEDRTPLNLACYYGNIDLAEFLIEKGADVNTKDNMGRTLLSWACYYENINLAKFLIEKGADVNATNKAGSTPLIFACRENNTELAKLLIKQGANILCLNEDNNLRNGFEVQIKKALDLETLIGNLAVEIYAHKDYVLSMKEIIEQIDKFMLDPWTPVYSKQSALSELLKYHIPKKQLLPYFNQILFNNRFLQNKDFKDVLKFAIQNNAKDRLNRSVLVAAMFYCNDNQIGKIFSKIFEIHGDLYRNSDLFKKWRKEYYSKESWYKIFVNAFTIKRRIDVTDQEKAANDFIDALTLAKKMNRKKAFKLLMNYSIHSDYLKENDLVKAGISKKLKVVEKLKNECRFKTKHDYLKELKKSERIFENELNKKKDSTFLPSEIVANIMSF